ncbi:unnamed protein product, partial [marine sediment metagenome]
MSDVIKKMTEEEVKEVEEEKFSFEDSMNILKDMDTKIKKEQKA